jgi:hypothetical protein
LKSFEGLLGKNKKKEEIKKKLLEKGKGVFAKHTFIQKLKGLKNALSYVWQTCLTKEKTFFLWQKMGMPNTPLWLENGLAQPRGLGFLVWALAHKHNLK